MAAAAAAAGARPARAARLAARPRPRPAWSKPPIQPVERVTQGPRKPIIADRSMPGVFDIEAR